MFNVNYLTIRAFGSNDMSQAMIDTLSHCAGCNLLWSILKKF